VTAFILVYGQERIPYEVAFDPKRTSRVAIHVNPDGSVAVDAPPGFDDNSIRTAVQKRARWVVDHVNDARDRHAHVLTKEYVSGEQIIYLGRRYVLKVIPVDTKPRLVGLKGNRLEVETRTGSTADIRGRLRGWYRAKGRDYFDRRIKSLSGELPWVTSIPKFRLLDMSRQWGSCSTEGEIILNTHLIKAPRACIDYVIIHEMAHLKHHDHGPAFWQLINGHIPGWRETKRKLDGLVEVLLTE